MTDDGPGATARSAQERTSARAGESAVPAQQLVTDVFARGCTSRAAFEDVTSRWASLALLALGESSYRFNALRRRVEGVSEKMLAQTLQSLERDGMVTRDVITAIPPRVEYALTPLGARVAASLRDLADLLEASVADVDAARATYTQPRDRPA